MSDVREFAHERYVSLATTRRNGVDVATPVWVACAENRLYVFSEARAGKVKRIRNNSAVKLSPCDMRGNVNGEWSAGEARIVDDPETIAAAYRALREKYGWQMWIADCLSKLSGRYDQRAMIEISM